jgi:hypothetical protein
MGATSLDLYVMSSIDGKWNNILSLDHYVMCSMTLSHEVEVFFMFFMQISEENLI